MAVDPTPWLNQSAEEIFGGLARQAQAHWGPVNLLRAALGQAPRQINTVSDYVRQASERDKKIPLKGLAHLKKKDTDVLAAPNLSDLDKVKDQIKTQKKKIAGAGDLAKKDSWWDTIKKDTLNLGAHIVDYASRPGAAVLAGYDTVADRVLDEGEDPRGVLDKRTLGNMWGAFTGKDEDKVTGKDIVMEHTPVGGMSGGWQKTALGEGLGLVGEIASDPTTYIGTGAANTAAKSAAQVIAKEGTKTLAQKVATVGITQASRARKTAQIARPSQKVLTGVQKGVDEATAQLKIGQTVAKGGRKVSEREIDSAVSRIVADQIKPGASSVLRRKAEVEVRKKIRLLKQAGHDTSKIDIAAREAMVQEFATDLAKPWAQQIKTVLTANTRRKAQFKILGRDVLQSKLGEPLGKALYKPFGLAAKGGNKLPGMAALKSGFQMGEHFPDLTNRLRRLTEGHGVVRHEAMSKTITNAVKGLNKDERKQILLSLERGQRTVGRSASGRDLGEVYDWFDQFRKDSFSEMEAAGIYDAADNAGDMFAPLHMRKGDPLKLKEFRAARKQALKQGLGGHLDYGVEAAKRQGLKPFELVDDAFKSYDADVSRKLTRENYRVDLLNQYGIKTAAHDAMKERGMVDATHLVPNYKRKAMEKSGEKIYLHPEYFKSLDTMEQFAKRGNNEELNRFMRNTNKGTNWFKQSATVYNPGNWVNNTMGDMFLNFVDGLQNPIWYKHAAKALRQGASGTIKVGEHHVPVQRVRELYEKWAKGAGFLQADVTSEGLGRLPGRGGERLQKMSKGVKTAYQGREDFSRMAHFLYSMDEEFKRLPKTRGRTGNLKIGKLNQGGSAFEKAINDAAERAGERVSKWNLDYSAFTPTEQNIKKFIPFYSWQRKSIPLILEALATKPGRITSIEHAKDSLESLLTGDERGDYDTAYPKWLRDGGFMRIFGGEEPTVIKNPLPTNVLGGAFTGADWGEVLKGQLATLHPGVRAPIEMGTGEQLFTGAKMPDDATKYIASQLPFLGPLSSLKGEDLRAGLDPETPAKQLTPFERIMSLAGSKPYKIDEAMQTSELRRQQDVLDFQMTRINKATAPWTVRKNKDGTFQAYNEDTKEKGPKVNDAGLAQSHAAAYAAGRR